MREDAVLPRALTETLIDEIAKMLALPQSQRIRQMITWVTASGLRSRTNSSAR